MTPAIYLLLGMATLGILLSTITRMTLRGIPRHELNRMPIVPSLLMATNLPAQIALVAWAFLALPWPWALGGLVFIVTVGALVSGALLSPIVTNMDRVEVLLRIRPALDLALIIGTVALWWVYWPWNR